MRRTHLALLPLLCSCTFFRAAEVPMPAVRHAAPAGNATGLIVMLPGMGDQPDDYVKNGFVAMVHAANPNMDVLCADAHFGYYKNSSIVERLHEDLIASIAKQYQHVWLLGISLGGLGTVAYAAEHPDVVDGVILLAPYMGNKAVIDEVRAAGGPRSWQQPDSSEPLNASERRYYELWTWYHDVVTQPERMPRLFLGCGEQDGFHAATQLVAAELPQQQTMTCPGGHKWTVWRELFTQLAPNALTDLSRPLAPRPD
jgi:pimeloyl-ACP methyl ester carboxylesterase